MTLCGKTTRLIHMLDKRGTLNELEALEKPHRGPLKRLARGVALAIGLSLFIPSAHAPALNLKPKEFAYYALNYNKTQYKCLARLWGKESAWKHTAVSYDGSAYGIPQLRNKKVLHLDANTQVIWGLRYIKHRYETPCAALRHWRIKGNY